MNRELLARLLPSSVLHVGHILTRENLTDG
jgi:hypothetical protein